MLRRLKANEIEGDERQLRDEDIARCFLQACTVKAQELAGRITAAQSREAQQALGTAWLSKEPTRPRAM